jgi:hypothetical protein
MSYALGESKVAEVSQVVEICLKCSRGCWGMPEMSSKRLGFAIEGMPEVGPRCLRGT